MLVVGEGCWLVERINIRDNYNLVVNMIMERLVEDGFNKEIKGYWELLSWLLKLS